jgi:alpha-N-acetylglucosaminidase
MLLKHTFFTSLLTIGLLMQPAVVCGESSTAPAEGVLQRLMPHLAHQFELALVPKPDHKDYFRIAGTRGHIRVEAATQPTLLYGVN